MCFRARILPSGEVLTGDAPENVKPSSQFFLHFLPPPRLPSFHRQAHRMWWFSSSLRPASAACTRVSSACALAVRPNGGYRCRNKKSVPGSSKASFLLKTDTSCPCAPSGSRGSWLFAWLLSETLPCSATDRTGFTATMKLLCCLFTALLSGGDAFGEFYVCASRGQHVPSRSLFMSFGKHDKHGLTRQKTDQQDESH